MRKLLAPLLFLSAITLSAGTSNWGVFPIVGSVNNFRTDTRLYNSSETNDITVRLFLMRTGNVANFVQPITRTIPKHSMLSLDDVLSSAFNETGIGALIVESVGGPFSGTSRIYATTPAGTFGQFTQILNVGGYAYTKAVLLQLRSDAAFRTNVGFVNVQNNTATVTVTLFDGNNVQLAEKTFEMPSYAVIGPTPLTSDFYSTDINGRVIGYASVIDNATSDPSFIPPQSAQ
jgi:hypothetical protein